MSLTPEVNSPAPPTIALVIPETRGGAWKGWLIAALGVVVSGSMVAWKVGIDPRRLVAGQVVELPTVLVDEGTMVALITETGSLESSDNATVRCHVEALMGVTGGAQGMQGGRPGVGQPGQQGAQGMLPPATAKMKGAAKGRAGGAASKAGSTASKTAAANATASKTAASATPAPATSGGGGASAGGAGATGAAPAAQKPVIRSFTYLVASYIPQPKPMGAVNQAKPAVNQAMTKGRRGGGGMGTEEKSGSTRIISILEQGKRVAKGDVLCELDSSAFRDELQAQEIRWTKAKAAVEQVQTILEVNEITLIEYAKGIFPQDKQLVHRYIQTCQVESDRARKNLDWSKATAAKGFRSATQVQADALAAEQTDYALKEANGMAYRLESYTGPKILKHLQAKLEAIKADKLAQDSTFQLESNRKRKLERMIVNCTLRAPRDGIVVYANQANAWGRVDSQIQEGVTVRESQPIINLPDPNHMRVRAKINESKVAFVHKGQRVQILVDAFPDRPMRGIVAEVTPIPAPVNGPISDVRAYFATVDIALGGFDELRPGLSAEVSFLVEDPRKVVRVPLQAVRWVDHRPYAAVSNSPEAAASNGSESSWRWRSLSLGLTDRSYAEVVSGLKPGDRVVAHPEELPAPVAAPETKSPPAAVASAGGRTSG